MEKLNNIIFIDLQLNSRIFYLILIIILSINSLWSQKIQWSHRTHEFQPTEVEEIEECLGFDIKKIYVELNTNDTLRLRRGFIPRYFSELRLEYNNQLEVYDVKILINRNSALNLENFQFCFTSFFERVNQAGKHIVEIEFESDIALANRLVEFENTMYSLANSCIDRFIIPDQYYHPHDEEAKYLRNAKKEIQFKISKEFDNPNPQIISKYLTQLKQDSLTETKLHNMKFDFKNFNKFLREYESELDNLLVSIINSNR